jgi:aspartate kinase
MTDLIVQKYGGATLADAQKIKKVAARIAGLSKKGKKIAVVVSAMGKTTDQLVALATQVSAIPNRRELDMLLSTGERVSMALLSIALNDLGVSAISFTGSQAGILTSDSHVNAFIEQINAPRVHEALEKNKIVVLAGFQGVSPRTKEITTLGRGGSDITAVAMSAYLKAERCEILKDVDAVMSADPKVVERVRPLHHLTYKQLMEMTFWGAKVLHYRSVELASLFRVPLFIGSAGEEVLGTKVDSGGDMQKLEETKIISLNSHEFVVEIKTNLENESVALREFENILTEKEIPFPQILFICKANDIRIFVTGPEENMQALEREFKQNKKFYLGESQLSTVAATCVGTTSAALPLSISKKLNDSGIKVQHLQMSPLSLVVYVERDCREKAMRVLHSLID